MHDLRIIDKNEDIISCIRNICVQAALQITADTEGVISTNAKSAPELDSGIELLNNVVDHELIRRYGE